MIWEPESCETPCQLRYTCERCLAQEGQQTCGWSTDKKLCLKNNETLISAPMDCPIEVGLNPEEDVRKESDHGYSPTNGNSPIQSWIIVIFITVSVFGALWKYRLTKNVVY